MSRRIALRVGALFLVVAVFVAAVAILAVSWFDLVGASRDAAEAEALVATHTPGIDAANLNVSGAEDALSDAQKELRDDDAENPYWTIYLHETVSKALSAVAGANTVLAQRQGDQLADALLAAAARAAESAAAQRLTLTAQIAFPVSAGVLIGFIVLLVLTRKPRASEPRAEE